MRQVRTSDLPLVSLGGQYPNTCYIQAWKVLLKVFGEGITWVEYSLTVSLVC